jgi:hypothetical protein
MRVELVSELVVLRDDHDRGLLLHTVTVTVTVTPVLAMTEILGRRFNYNTLMP